MDTPGNEHRLDEQDINSDFFAFSPTTPGRRGVFGLPLNTPFSERNQDNNNNNVGQSPFHISDNLFNSNLGSPVHGYSQFAANRLDAINYYFRYESYISTN